MLRIMRTTIDLDPDVHAAVTQLRAQQGIGLSQAVNELARAGLQPRHAQPYAHRSTRLGLKIDITDIGNVLDVLDES
jgi:hypothetical protein